MRLTLDQPVRCVQRGLWVKIRDKPGHDDEGTTPGHTDSYAGGRDEERQASDRLDIDLPNEPSFR
jgi:hypothetical protein